MSRQHPALERTVGNQATTRLPYAGLRTPSAPRHLAGDGIVAVLPKSVPRMRDFAGSRPCVTQSKLLELSTDLPIMIEIVDSEEKVDAFLPAVAERVTRTRHARPSQRSAGRSVCRSFRCRSCLQNAPSSGLFACLPINLARQGRRRSAALVELAPFWRFFAPETASPRDGDAN